MKKMKKNSQKIKKLNFILTMLTLTFILIMFTFVNDVISDGSFSLFLETREPSIIEIKEDHSVKMLSHGAPGVGCADCHLSPINSISICRTLCHYDGGMAKVPPEIIGGDLPGGNVSLYHHNISAEFKNCLNYICHEDPDHENDARYVLLSAYQGHDACMCHEFGHSSNPPNHD